MMNKEKYRIKILGLLTFLSLILCLIACKKEIKEALPGDIKDVAFNFYSASDVMQTAYGPGGPGQLISAVAFYVDEYNEQSGGPNTSSFPFFSFGSKTAPEYPSSNNGSMNYVRHTADNHRLFFTDINNTVVLDTTIKTVAESFNSFYLADMPANPGGPAVYKLITATEDRKVPEGKTGVRFIHLSPDAGNISCNLKKANGDLVNILAGELSFGQVSDYQFFNPEDVASDGLLRFTLSNSANGVNFNTGIIFNPGRSYIVVIKGFRTDQQREVAVGKNPDGSIKKEILTIGNNLRAEIRTSH